MAAEAEARGVQGIGARCVRSSTCWSGTALLEVCGPDGGPRAHEPYIVERELDNAQYDGTSGRIVPRGAEGHEQPLRCGRSVTSVSEVSRRTL